MSMLDDTQTSAAAPDVATDEAFGAALSQPALPPLAISALLVTKADLIAALRVYLPHVSDIEVLDGGERFLLSVAPHPSEHGENGAS